MNQTHGRFAPSPVDGVRALAGAGMLATRRAASRIVALFALVALSAACSDTPFEPELQPTAPVESRHADRAVSNLKVASGRPYVIAGNLGNGARVYVDRTYSYRDVPDHLKGLWYIRTGNGDQGLSGNNDFLSFTLDRAAEVYVVSHGSQPQGWLASRGFTATGETLTVEKDRDRNEYTIYSRSFSAGTVALGSNRHANGSPQMYTVVIKPGNPQPAPSSNVSRPSGFAAVVQGVRPRGFGKGTYSTVSPASGGTTYYVSPSGSDSNAGTNSNPFRTINKAAQVAGAGDVVTIRAGTYRESVSVRNPGTASRPIVFQAASRGTVVLTGGRYTFGPARYHGGVQQDGSVYVTLRGLIFRDYARTTENVATRAAVGAIRGWRIEDCLFEASGYSGLDIRGDDVTVERSTFRDHHTLALTAVAASNRPLLRNTVLRDVVLSGNNARTDPLGGSVSTKVVKFYRTSGVVVDNLESFGNKGPGLWFDTDNVHFTVRNSYIHGNLTGSGRGLFIEVNHAPGLVENNVFANNSVSGVTVANSRGVTVTGNLFVGNPHSVHLVNAARGSNYNLRDVTITRNSFKGWTKSSNIHPGGVNISSPSQMNVTADHNVYDSGSVSEMSYWSHTGWIRNISDMRSKLGWERNGREARVDSPI